MIAGDGPNTSHTTSVTVAMTMTAGTNQAAITSASRAMGGLDPCACSTRRTICASAVSLPTLVARNVNEPVVFMVAPMTSSPGCLPTGIGSPVSMLSSTGDTPSSTTPSTGTFSPGRTTTRSPTSTWATGTSVSEPPRTTRAVLGCRPMRALMAAPVCPLARASSSRPSRISVMMKAAESKYIGTLMPSCSKRPGKRTPITL